MNHHTFHCISCGRCCRVDGIVIIHKDEIPGIAIHLGLEPEDFITQYLGRHTEETYRLRTPVHGPCIFLENNQCRIYPVRPKQCKDFPSRWTREDLAPYCQAIKGMHDRA